MARKKKTKKSFFELTDDEKTQVVREFDRPIPASRFRPLSKKQRLLWERARANKPDVSIYVGEDKTDVLIHLDPDLLAQARAFAAKNKTSLPKMIDRGLRGLLAFGS
jgi:hypothetical protein